MADENNYPIEIQEMEREKIAELRKYYTWGNEGDEENKTDEYIYVGPKKYVLAYPFKQQCDKIYNMKLRPSDIFVVTFPRSGTTWTQEMVWLLANDLDYTKAAATYLTERFPFLEYSMFFNDEVRQLLMNQYQDDEEKRQVLKYTITPVVDFIEEIPSPRFIKSHLPISLLPPNLLETTKVVYVARNPKDVAVSYYYHIKSMQLAGSVGDFKTSWDFFMRDMLPWTPIFEHHKEAWALRDHPNMLFLFYEDINKDLPSTLRRIAKFLGKEYNDEQYMTLCEHLKIDNFRKNKSVNFDEAKQLETIWKSEVSNFIRQGKTGGWREHFDEEMIQQAEKWIADNLQDTDMRYPEV